VKGLAYGPSSVDLTQFLTRKLENFAQLGEAEKLALEILGRDCKFHPGHVDIMFDGDSLESVILMLDGFACRYKHLDDGRRQITGYLVPGDLCDPYVFMLRKIDYSVATLCPALIAKVPRSKLVKILDEYPRIARALWWSALVDEGILREWVVSIGRRTALERTAHLICELYHRLQAVGLARNNRCEFPITQQDLADSLGLSAVHVNRTLQELRSKKLIVQRNHSLVMLDPEKLRDLALFKQSYLHMAEDGNNSRHESMTSRAKHAPPLSRVIDQKGG